MKRKARFDPKRGQLRIVKQFSCPCGRTIEFLALAKIKRPRCHDAFIELKVSGGAIITKETAKHEC